ncbi:membrane protein [Comamonas phosphati]|nr:membrane protein [Comamonas phosphati]
MTQITRCPSCGTRFKVVADQLRISQGWVRCGVCQNVFDASLDLLELPDAVLFNAAAKAAAAEASQPARPPSANAAVRETQSFGVAAKPVADGEERQPSGHEPFLESLFEPSLADQAGSWRRPEVPQDPVAPEPRDDASSMAAAVPDAEPAGEPLFAPSSAFAGDAQRARRQVEAEQEEDGDADGPEFGTGEAGQALPAAQAEPGFVRQARRKAFWHSAAVRGMLLLGCMMAVGGLATQMLWHRRDALAVQYPSLQPVLRTLCLAAGCKLQARREISDVVISSSGFKQLPGQRQYLWSLSLENRSEVPVAMPVAELTLTDAQDRPLLRRVVELVPLGAPAQLRGHEEWGVSVPVQVQELAVPVAGYRALVFYP